MRIQIAIRSLLFFALSVSPLWAGDAVQWAPSIEVAKMAAAAKGQLVLIHFWGDNCPPCARLDAQVYNQPAFAQSLEKDYVPVKINASQNPDIAKQYQVDRWPQDVIITANGQFVYRMISPQEVDRYTDVLSQVAGKASSLGNQVAQAGTSPAGSSGPAAQAAGQSTAAQSAAASRYSRYSSDGDTGPAAGPSQPEAGPISQFSAVPPGGQPGTAQPSQNMFATSPRSGVPLVAPSGASSAADQNRPPSGSNNPSPAAASRSVNDTAAGSGQPPKNTPSHPEFALDGYCPVTLIEQMNWKKGDKQFGAVHRGKVYLFGSEADQQKFLATPDKYSPVLSGLDPVAFVTEGRQAEGDRRYGLTYHGTLYLFSSEDNLQRFWNDPARYQTAVQQAMSRQNNRR